MHGVGINSGYLTSLTELIHLFELINEWLHDCSGRAGQSALGSMLLWAWGRLLLLKWSRDDFHREAKWSACLAELGVSFSSYSKVWVEQQTMCVKSRVLNHDFSCKDLLSNATCQCLVLLSNRCKATRSWS